MHIKLYTFIKNEKFYVKFPYVAIENVMKILIVYVNLTHLTQTFL